MTTKQFNKLYKEKILPTIEKMRQGGQEEYANDLENIFANFDRSANRRGLKRNQVIGCHMDKHFDGITNYISNKKEQREKIEGRIADLIVYLMLLWASIEEEKSLLINIIDDLER